MNNRGTEAEKTKVPQLNAEVEAILAGWPSET